MNVYPRGRILLRFDDDTSARPDDFRRQLSACAIDDDGHLWLGTDELNGLSRLKPKSSGAFLKHAYQDLESRLDLPDKGEEIDIEGLDIQENQIWVVGSHTSTRKKVKAGKGVAENLERLGEVKVNPNRSLVACLRIKDGRIDDDNPRQLPIVGSGNALTEALRTDPHLGPFMQTSAGRRSSGPVPLASKENGFDIEGAAIRGRRLFLGLRGPVLRGWSLVLEVEIADAKGALSLAPLGDDGRPYRKHFVDLGGMGVRDLIWQGDDLFILAGPTMDITGLQSVHHLRDAAALTDDSITDLTTGRLTCRFHLPHINDGDKAEGLCRFDDSPALEGKPGLLVVYDSPRADRLVAEDAVLADVFAL